MNALGAEVPVAGGLSMPRDREVRGRREGVLASGLCDELGRIEDVSLQRGECRRAFASGRRGGVGSMGRARCAASDGSPMGHAAWCMALTTRCGVG